MKAIKSIEQAESLYDALTDAANKGKLKECIISFAEEYGWNEEDQLAVSRIIKSREDYGDGALSDMLVFLLDDSCFDKNGELVF